MWLRSIYSVSAHKFTYLNIIEKNSNAGISYRKAAAAVRDIEEEITADNALTFSKGKSKLPGIGKGTAEKMKEFAESGKIEKLEEKRAADS